MLAAGGPAVWKRNISRASASSWQSPAGSAEAGTQNVEPTE